jgi:hypothetical protein
VFYVLLSAPVSWGTTESKGAGSRSFASGSEVKGGPAKRDVYRRPLTPRKARQDCHRTKRKLRLTQDSFTGLDQGSLRADQDSWDLQAPISAAGDIFGRKPRCAARSRDVADGSGACSRNAFRRFPFGAHRSRESNPGAWSAIAD